MEEGLLQAGIGVSTGLAYTGVVGSDNCSDYTALGDTVNIASRLQGEAAGGEVLVTEEVYAKLSGYAGADHRTLRRCWVQVYGPAAVSSLSCAREMVPVRKKP